MLSCSVTLLLNYMRSVLGAVAGPQLCCALDIVMDTYTWLYYQQTLRHRFMQNLRLILFSFFYFSRVHTRKMGKI